MHVGSAASSVYPNSCGEPNTLSLKLLGVAGKIVSHSGKITLKVTIFVWKRLSVYSYGSTAKPRLD